MTTEYRPTLEDAEKCARTLANCIKQQVLVYRKRGDEQYAISSRKDFYANAPSSPAERRAEYTIYRVFIR